jgi:chromosome segregation ATPase
LKSNVNNEEVENLKAKLKNAEKNYIDFKYKFEEMKSKYDAIYDKYANNKEFDSLKEQIKKISYQNMDFENKVHDLNDEITRLKDDIITKDKLISRTQKKNKKNKTLDDDEKENEKENHKLIQIDDFQKKITKEDLDLHPLVALKKSILVIISYFENQVDGEKSDLNDLGNGKKNPQLGIFK